MIASRLAHVGASGRRITDSDSLMISCTSFVTLPTVGMETNDREYILSLLVVEQHKWGSSGR